MAEGNALSFLRVSRAEIELDPSCDPHADSVYERATANFARLKNSSFVVEDEPSVYIYRMRRGEHEQTGLAACFSLDEYERDTIKKHERTRHDKEDDRTRHILALRAQTGLAFLTYRASPDVDRLTADAVRRQPLYDFDADVDDSVHTIWKAGRDASAAFVHAFAGIPSLYIADGHHRVAGAARARARLRQTGSMTGLPAAAHADCDGFVAVAFPHDQVQILPYNRIVRDLGGLSPTEFVEAVSSRFTMDEGPAVPARHGEIAMYFQGAWQTLRPRTAAAATDPIARLDVSVLQDSLLSPVLRIADPRADRRIDFVGGARGTAELQRLVDRAEAAVAFSMFPVTVTDLMAIADAGGVMPPKSTWFEPKLRDGLIIHAI